MAPNLLSPFYISHEIHDKQNGTKVTYWSNIASTKLIESKPSQLYHMKRFWFHGKN
jgi:hypothetical protein